MSSAICFTLDQTKMLSSGNGLYKFYSKNTNSYFKLKEFADDNFKFHTNERKLSKQVENTVGKGEIACYKQFLLFP